MIEDLLDTVDTALAAFNTVTTATILVCIVFLLFRIVFANARDKQLALMLVHQVDTKQTINDSTMDYKPSGEISVNKRHW